MTASAAKPSNIARMGLADMRAVVVLLVLYFLQGVPMGISAAMPMLFQDANVSDADQGKFSFSSWPFSLKILWAPIVDAVYSRGLGRRRSWVVPMQFVIAVVLYICSLGVDDMLDASTGDGIDVASLTTIFFVLFFCCATQDVAVDGWALTMLSPAYVGYGSVCNTIGQTLGSYAGYLVHAYDLLSLSQAMRLWAYFFLVTTTLVVMFCREKPSSVHTAVEGVREAYAGMWRITRLRHVRALIFVFFLVKAPFVIVEGLSGLRLQSVGMPKAAIANLAFVTTPVSLLLPIFIKPGNRVLDLFSDSFMPRMLLGLVCALLVYFAPASFTDPVPYVRVAGQSRVAQRRGLVAEMVRAAYWRLPPPLRCWCVAWSVMLQWRRFRSRLHLLVQVAVAM
jgi:PAT family acetyl-CoA transporter-like MFS transporter 1